MSLHIHFKRWILVCVVLPSLALFLVVNVVLWMYLRQSHRSEFENLTHLATAGVERTLASESARLRALAELPATQDLLRSVENNQRQFSIPRRREQNALIHSQWTTLARHELVVRSVLDNTAAEMLRYLSETDARIQSLVLTDAAGAVVASSGRTALYDHSALPWWKAATGLQTSQVVGEGISPEGTLGLALSIWEREQQSVLRGVLHIEIKLDEADLMAAIADNLDYAIVLRANQMWFLGGNQHVVGHAAAAVEQLPAAVEADQSVWLGGLRAFIHPVEAGLHWLHPVQVVTLRTEGRFPAKIYGPLGLGILLSGLFFAALLIGARRAGQNIVLTPIQDVIDAGQWALARLNPQGKPGNSGVAGNAALSITDTPEPDSALTAHLNDWLKQFRLQAQADELAQSAELKKDLELARDFQMAFLNRPYPTVPEVHIEGRLRLGFAHRYEPALALGGDFFDLLALGPDCAGVFLSDVMGHGTRSALITAMLRTLIGDLASQGRNARHFVTELNRQFMQMIRHLPNPLFASAFYFVADTTSRVATYTTAGHPAPFHVRRSIGRITRLELSAPRGAALGLVENESFPGGHCRLVAGDLFIFFTDGLYEAANPAGEEFGLGRMESAIRRNLYKGTGQILDAIMADLREFVAEEPVADDICLVAVEVATDALETHAGVVRRISD